MRSIKNRDLFYWPSRDRPDNLFVVTEPPGQNDNATVIDIHLNEYAAVLDGVASLYPDQPTLTEIRSGNGTHWLLSGGTLITDHENRIAVGLRDGNSTNPFVFTNIGAGRCDQKLMDHCEQEMASEFILCLKKNDQNWYQADFGKDMQLLIHLNKPDVENRVKAMVQSMNQTGGRLTQPQQLKATIPTNITGNIVVNWIDFNHTQPEALAGYILIDERHKTTEFRLGLSLDLSEYTDNCIFYGEGTGYAVWMSLEKIRRLAQAEKIAQQDFLTPFLRAL